MILKSEQLHLVIPSETTITLLIQKHNLGTIYFSPLL